MGKREKDILLFFLPENLLLVFFEEIIIFVETDVEEVEEIFDINYIVSDGTEVSGQFNIEIQNIFEVARYRSAANLLNFRVEYFNFLGENIDLVLDSQNHSVLPNPHLLKKTCLLNKSFMKSSSLSLYYLCFLQYSLVAFLVAPLYDYCVLIGGRVLASVEYGHAICITQLI